MNHRADPVCLSANTKEGDKKYESNLYERTGTGVFSAFYQAECRDAAAPMGGAVRAVAAQAGRTVVS